MEEGKIEDARERLVRESGYINEERNLKRKE